MLKRVEKILDNIDSSRLELNEGLKFLLQVDGELEAEYTADRTPQGQGEALSLLNLLEIEE